MINETFPRRSCGWARASHPPIHPQAAFLTRDENAYRALKDDMRCVGLGEAG
jgi:hypothetical protein